MEVVFQGSDSTSILHQPLRTSLWFWTPLMVASERTGLCDWHQTFR